MLVTNVTLIVFLVIISCNADNMFEFPALNVSDTIRYKPTWDSLATRPIPEWYDKVKIGIFLHFGVYSAAAFGNEWLWKRWKENKQIFVDFITRTQRPGFTYQEFAEQFKCEHFDAIQWAEIFKDAGANYVVLTSKHHEGYTLWPSAHSFSWNSVDIGPGRDIIRELSEAVRAANMKFGIYYSLYEWFNRMYLKDKSSMFREQSYVEMKLWPELQDLVKSYKPEIIWSDGDWEAPPEYWKSQEFIAWLYNDSPVKDTVVTNDRWGRKIWCLHGDFITCGDKFNPGMLMDRKFESAISIDKRSFGYRAEADLDELLTSEELIKYIVRIIAINGNLLINIGPTKYGTIELAYRERLRDMGKWLKINGKAIYETRPWRVVQSEGNLSFTMKTGPIRDTVFVFVLDYPYEDNFVVVRSLGKLVDSKSVVKLIGYDGKVEFHAAQDGLRINFPEKRFIDKAGLFCVWTFEVDIPKASKIELQ